ncbi:hypothetical protein AQUCO_02400004v1 [Aquilegia coerulea]|uniref:Response regulatory domain-containing protein n=1 Tax=Aquilegia coerulea TaxID=218851 RepID=A0A2G5DAW4_AQUCA|nr:hypothetical protein AQUCO_02400004v1 [Aquilegia coerulea]
MAGIPVKNPQSKYMRVGLHVLVVDDDPFALLNAERMLTIKNYKVTTATGCREALSLLKNSDVHFDLVLSELYLPGMDGYQLLEIVRTVYNIPFIFMSSDHTLDVMERGLEAGARFFFLKPLTMSNYESMWQFVYTENIEYFRAMNIERRQGPSPPPQDRPSSLSISDYTTRKQGRNSSSSSNTSNRKKQRQDDGQDNKKQKRPYKKRGKEDQNFGKNIAAVPPKKTRVIWTSQLHEKFLLALRILSKARVVPKRIQALMKIRELSRANIASHLQKYRLYLNKYKGTSESDYPRRRIRMRLPDETEYHDYLPSDDHSMWYDSYNYQNRPQSPLQANQPGLRDNFHPPNNLNHVPSAGPQYIFQEGSNDNYFMAQANQPGHPTEVTKPGYLGRPWMSGGPTMDQSNVGAYPSLFGTSAPLYGNDLNIGSTTNATPILVEQQLNQGNAGFLPNAPLDPNFGNLSSESLQNSSHSADYIGNMAPFGAWNGIGTGTMGCEISNNGNSTDISRMDEIQMGKKPVEKAINEFSLPDDPLYLNGMNFNSTSEGEPFAVNPNYVVVGESSTRALVNPCKVQQGNEVNNSGRFDIVNDIEDYLPNQGYKIANEACVILEPI